MHTRARLYVACSSFAFTAAACEPAVQFALGQHHFSHQDYAQALKYFEKAAGLTPGEAANSTAAATAGSSAQAKYQLGVMYYDGLGVKEDPVRNPRHINQPLLLWLP